MGKGAPRMKQQPFEEPGGVPGQGGPARRQVFEELAESLKGGTGVRNPVVRQAVARVRRTARRDAVRNP